MYHFDNPKKKINRTSLCDVFSHQERHAKIDCQRYNALEYRWQQVIEQTNICFK